MRKKLLVGMLCLTVVAVLLTAFWSRPFRSIAAGTEFRGRLGFFDVKRPFPPNYDLENTRIQKLVAGPTGLYFLLQRVADRKHSVLQTDFAGNHQRHTEVYSTPESHSQVQAIRVDSSGRLFCYQVEVSKWNKQDRQRWIRVYTREGALETSTQVQEFATDFCVLGESIFYIPSGGGVRKILEATGGTETDIVRLSSDNRSDYCRISPLSDNQVVLLDGIRARIYLVDLTLNRSAEISLEETPEVQHGWKAYSPEELGETANTAVKWARAVILPDLATTKKGDIYLTVMGHTLAHWVILHLDGRGNIVRTLHCSLPKVAQLERPSNPEGYIFPVAMAANETQLFLVSAEGFVASYPL